MSTRRTFLRASAAGGASVVLSGAAGSPRASAARRDDPRVYVLVIDGCRPDEIDDELTPRLAALRRAGRSYPQARSVPIMETLPNHAMMMAGVRPDRSGVPANSFYDAHEGAVRDLDRASDLRFPTVLQRLRTKGLTTGTVLSKKYLYSLFGERATYRWEPEPLMPITDHALDGFTHAALGAMVRDADPHLLFANFGDIDRFGHADLTGGSIKLLRRLALASTDRLIGDFVDFLKESGRWRRSVLVVLADHSMDWSDPFSFVSLADAFKDDSLLAGNVAYADNGGADLLTWTGPKPQRDKAVRRMRRLARDVPGVLSLHDPHALRLGPRGGDLVAYCRSGWRFSDPNPLANPIPGNHGHPATAPIPFFIAGGSPLVRRGASSARARTLDVAPTVGEVFGLRPPRGGYDGRSRV
ncbi:alkaline phosphatase family protein [Solicola gregarius]|uniref:Alkaline phosphatase family protein n=1 Tax=Solicola gregarius TaxID=2908642 RepID=A0AA46YKL5_9ACTN|nr:alkaline phosphatase family protein [Solicola gregarius]UYM04601.1 alkaline phosphatase family protein [Solicola gregarius]